MAGRMGSIKKFALNCSFNLTLLIMIRIACLSRFRVICLSAICFISGTQFVQAQADSLDDHKLTEIYTPVPPVVTPGKTPADAPSDAIILFDGKNQDEWVSAKDGQTPANWVVGHGALTVSKEFGSIQTKRNF